jgi:protein O-GlcNAcase/histone acetyltransferase
MIGITSLLGPKVISNIISPNSIQTLARVLKRKPVIWDNIHANDYDQRRMFLGPYDGRPTELYTSVNGVLTNPNCEFESNFVAIHTLGTWVRCSRGDLPCPVPAEEPMSLDVESEKQSISSDVMDDDTEVSEKDEHDKIEKMESKDNGNGGEFPMETDSIISAVGTAKMSNIISGLYDPNLALKDAISDWLMEFSKEKSASSKVYAKSGPYSLVPAPTIVQSQANSMSNTTTTSSNNTTFCSPSTTKTAKQNSRKERGLTPPPGKFQFLRALFYISYLPVFQTKVNH